MKSPKITFEQLWESQRIWSESTFPNAQGTPLGSLKHLADEVQEAIETPTDLEEYADIGILFMEASRKAGFSSKVILEAIDHKQKKNRLRMWRKSDGDGSEPIVHKKGESLPTHCASCDADLTECSFCCCPDSQDREHWKYEERILNL